MLIFKRSGLEKSFSITISISEICCESKVLTAHEFIPRRRLGVNDTRNSTGGALHRLWLVGAKSKN